MDQVSCLTRSIIVERLSAPGCFVLGIIQLDECSNSQVVLSTKPPNPPFTWPCDVSKRTARHKLDQWLSVIAFLSRSPAIWKHSS